MNIIFGSDQAQQLEEKYTVLELDTIRIGNNTPITAYCTIEDLPVTDLPKVDSMRKLHSNLIEHYKKGDWKFCTDALEHLVGFWNGEVDSFYAEITARINKLKTQDLSGAWDPIIQK